MKRKAILSCLLFFFLCGAYALEGLKFSVEPKISYAYCNLGEHLYAHDTKREVSFLDWKAKRIFCLGLSGSAEYGSFLVLSGISFGLPFECGRQTNEDYSSNTGERYNHTEEKLNLRRFIDTEIYAGWEKKVSENAGIIFSSGFEFNQTKLKGSFGKGYHSGRPVKVYPAHYERNALYWFVGLGFGYDFGSLDVSLLGYVSPYSYFCSYDTHTGSARDVVFRDRLLTYWERYKASFNVCYEMNEHLSFVNRTTLVYGGPYGKGDMYSTKYSYSLEKELMGTSQDVLKVSSSLGIKYRF